MLFNPQHAISAYLEEDAILPYSGTPATVEVREIGRLRLPTGKIVACDPLVYPGHTPPFTRTVPTGTYPVRIAIAHFGDDQRVAYAGIFFSDAVVTTWESALLPEQDQPGLDDYEFTYPVDAGTGCFADADATAALYAQIQRDNDHYEQIIQLMRPNTVGNSSWADHTPPESESNVIMFTSGYGDGSYSSYFGIDADSNTACLLTDFDVLGDELPEDENPEPERSAPQKKWWQFLKA